MPKIDKLLLQMKEVGASDLHYTVGCPPKMRIHGDMQTLDLPVITMEEARDTLFEIVTAEQQKTFLQERDLDFAYGLPGYARYRTNFLFQQNGIGAVFRMIPEKIMTLDQLNAPKAILQFVQLGSGLVVVTGPTGSGKTTTLATVINYINENYYRHILTIEEPIEFVHPNKKCLVTQREVGTDTRSFSAALRSAMREDPNVILVGEMRDQETISLALTCAEMGILVFGTLHTNSAPKTVDRVIDVFPSEEQARIRTMLASSLTGVIAQQLCRRCDIAGRVAAYEVLVGSPALGAVIRTGEVSKIESMIQAGGSVGMQTMDGAIMNLLQNGWISGEEAYAKSFDKRVFEQYYKIEGAEAEGEEEK
ncbi:MAG: type IV pilus twitching motility protein PilT [Planctomycetes bacterium]|nr:type IV pilus twitching motility protein PilT [Planctomycetota bacterium]